MKSFLKFIIENNKQRFKKINEMRGEDDNPVPEEPSDPNAGSESIPDPQPFNGGNGTWEVPTNSDALQWVLNNSGIEITISDSDFPWWRPNGDFWGVPSFLLDLILEMQEIGISPSSILENIHSWGIDYGPNGNAIFSHFYINLSNFGMPGMGYFFTFQHANGVWSANPQYLPIGDSLPGVGTALGSIANMRRPIGYTNINSGDNALALPTGTSVYYINNAYYFVGTDGIVYTIGPTGLTTLSQSEIEALISSQGGWGSNPPIGFIGEPPFSGTNIDVPFGGQNGSITVIRNNPFWRRPPGTSGRGPSIGPGGIGPTRPFRPFDGPRIRF